MSTTYTTNKYLGYPAYNDTGFSVPINADFPQLDVALGGNQQFNLSAASGVVSVNANTYLGSYPSQSASYIPLSWTLTGTLTNNVTLQLPSGVGGHWIVNNQCTLGAYSITVSAVSGSSSTNLSTGVQAIYSDGLGNINTATPASGGYAPINSPAFTGTPTAPTPSGSSNSTQIATTAFVAGNFLTPASASATYLTISNASATYLPISTASATYLTISTASSTYAPLASPSLTGTPTAPTASTATNTTQLATTAYVQNNLSSYAPIASPAFSGTPSAPTAAPGTNTTQIATTAFVKAAVNPSAPPQVTVYVSGSGTYTTPVGALYLQVDGVGGGGGGSDGNGVVGSAGGNTTFGTSFLVANGGAAAGTALPGTGGTASGGNINWTGGAGGQVYYPSPNFGGGSGGQGGNGAISGPPAPFVRTATSANGGIGGGGSGEGNTNAPGQGGGGGGGFTAIVSSPAGTYAYAVGAGGAAGGSGGSGGPGLLRIIAHFQ